MSDILGNKLNVRSLLSGAIARCGAEQRCSLDLEELGDVMGTLVVLPVTRPPVVRGAPPKP